jgi:hypothetical protein
MRPRRISPQSTSVQVIGQETLVYDQTSHQAWCLNRISACVWRLCDGHRTVEEVAAAAAIELDAAVTAQIVMVTLAELRDKNLIHPDAMAAVPDAVTRRELMGKAGLAAAVLLPVVTSIFAPPASAQSGTANGMSGALGRAKPTP